MTRNTLDPNLASILDSIRATVGGEVEPAPVEEAEPEPAAAEASERRGSAKGGKKAAAPAAPAVPVPPASSSVEDFLANLIRPQVESWLNAHLPEIVQKMAADEIARLTGKS